MSAADFKQVLQMLLWRFGQCRSWGYHTGPVASYVSGSALAVDGAI